MTSKALKTRQLLQSSTSVLFSKMSGLSFNRHSPDELRFEPILPRLTGSGKPIAPASRVDGVAGRQMSCRAPKNVVFPVIEAHLSRRFDQTRDTKRATPSMRPVVAEVRRSSARCPRTGLAEWRPPPSGRRHNGRDDDLRADFDQLFLERRQRPFLDRLRRRQRAQEITEVVGERMKLKTRGVGGERPA